MNIFKNSELEINYNTSINRISFQNGKNGFVSCTIPSFNMVLCLLKNGSEFEHVVINQTVSELKIIKVGGNLALQFESNNRSSHIVINYSHANKIIEQGEAVLIRIKNIKNRFSKDSDNNSSEKNKFNKPPEVIKPLNIKRPNNLDIEASKSLKRSKSLVFSSPLKDLLVSEE